MRTSARDVLVAAFRSLPEEDQRECFQALRSAWAETCAGSESLADQYLASLVRVAEELGGTPGVADYKEVQGRLRGTPDEIAPFNPLYQFFGSSWPRALEAIGMSDSLSAASIEARFRKRRIGKVWRFAESQLRDALLSAAEHWGRPPTTGEYEWWRARELELLAARGDEPLVPSTGPFRVRFGSWENALLHFGFTPEQVKERFDGKHVVVQRDPDRYMPEGIEIVELADPKSVRLPLSRAQAERLVAEWNEMPRRSRYVVGARLGLGGREPLTLKQVGEPLELHLSRIQQIQLDAVAALCRATAGGSRAQVPAELREPVIESLHALARLPE